MSTDNDPSGPNETYGDKTDPAHVFDFHKTAEKKSTVPTESITLIVLTQDTVLTYVLPAEGSVTIGRSMKAGVCVDDPSMSRIHVLLTIVAPTQGGDAGLRIRDLRSSNGTRLRGERIEPERDIQFAHGDLIDLGQTTLVVKRGRPNGRVRRLCTHGYFELRLEDACQRAKSHPRPFAVLRIRVQGEPLTNAEEALTAFLGPQDLIALYAPSEYEILLSESSRQEAEQAAAGIRFALSRLGASVQLGLACYPQDGQEPEVLVACASAIVRGRTRAERSAASGSLIIEDPAMRQVYQLVDRIATSDISVLILGETGVGKEVLAKAIHARSKRADRPFLPINCGAVPAELLENELFGHEKGAFTGALRFKPGLFETASGGTVLLDEIGEMALETQVKLLRVIEERRFRRVGGIETHPLDVRFIAATNRNLEKELSAGTFREDLYYRLHGISVVIPPLRERISELPLLARSFAAECRLREGHAGDAVFSDEGMAVLCKYAWPGNVRELKNIIERAVVLAGDDRIGPEHFPLEKLASPLIFPQQPPPRGRLEAPLAPTTLPPKTREETLRLRGREAETLTDRPLDELIDHDASNLSHPGLEKAIDQAQAVGATTLAGQLEEFERDRIITALNACGGNQTRAAQTLGISRKALIARIARYGLTRPRKR